MLIGRLGLADTSSTGNLHKDPLLFFVFNPPSLGIERSMCLNPIIYKFNPRLSRIYVRNPGI
jgi:hypothetical protein